MEDRSGDVPLMTHGWVDGPVPTGTAAPAAGPLGSLNAQTDSPDRDKNAGGIAPASRYSVFSLARLPARTRAFFEDIQARQGRLCDAEHRYRAHKLWLLMCRLAVDLEKEDGHAALVRVEKVATIQQAWHDICRDAGWSDAYIKRATHAIAKTLGTIQPGLGQTVHPTIRAAHTVDDRSAYVGGEHSASGGFRVMHVLPQWIQRLGPGHLYTDMCVHWLHRAFSLLKSVSRGAGRDIASLAVLMSVGHEDGTVLPPVWTQYSSTSATGPMNLHEAKHALKGLSAMHLLDRYSHTRERIKPMRHICFAQLSRHVRWINVLFHQCLGNEEIPVPKNTYRRSQTRAVVQTFSASEASVSGWSTRLSDAGVQTTRLALVARLRDIEARVCSTPTVSTVTAFSAKEVQALLSAAFSPLEQLLLITLFVTALRIGGVARLTIPSNCIHTYVRAEDIPSSFTTTEKGNRVRTVTASVPMRILMARWIRTRLSSDPRWPSVPGQPACMFVFPCGKAVPSGHMSIGQLWQIFSNVCSRARLKGTHVHPHTVRHTVIQVLFEHSDGDLERVSKWVGHASPSITSAVYCKLTHTMLEERLAPPWLQGLNIKKTHRDNMLQIAQLIADPYVFSKEEYGQLHQAPVSRNDHPAQPCVQGQDTHDLPPSKKRRRTAADLLAKLQHRVAKKGQQERADVAGDC